MKVELNHRDSLVSILEFRGCHGLIKNSTFLAASHFERNQCVFLAFHRFTLTIVLQLQNMINIVICT